MTTRRRGAVVCVPAAVVLDPLLSLGVMRKVADAVVTRSLAERIEDRNTAVVTGDGKSSKQRLLQLSRPVALLA